MISLINYNLYLLISPLVGRLSGSSGKTPSRRLHSDVNSESPGAPQAFCPEIDPFVDGLFPWSDVFIQHLDTLWEKLKRIYIVCSPWIVSPELALVVIEAEVGTASSVSNLDALRCVQVVPGVLRVLLNRAL